VEGNTAIVTLNSINVTGDAIGVEEIKERIYWDEDARGLLFDFEGEITFTGDTYRFLQQRFKTDYDNPVPLNIVAYNPHSGNYETVVNGLVFTSDCEFNLYEKTVSCQIVDRGFFAKIRNNVNIGFSLGAPDSKLGEDISSSFSITDLRAVLFMNSATPAVGVNPSFFRKSMTAFDALSYLVAAMSDGEISFVSNYLTPVVGQETPHILSGRQLRGDTIDIGPVLSWSELFGDLSKLYNLAFAVEEYNVGQWRIRVEPIEYFRQTQSIQLFDVEFGVKESIETNLLYASAIAGSAETREDFDRPQTAIGLVVSGGTWNYIPKTPFVFQWQEDYYFQYNSNVDSEWNLRCESLITHSNIIYYVMSMFIFTPPNEADFDDSYDTKAFLICAYYKDYTASASTPILYSVGSPALFSVFNNSISNYNVLVRNADGLPANAASQYASFGQQYFDAYFEPLPIYDPFTKYNMSPSGGGTTLKDMYLVYDYNLGAPIGSWANNLTIFGSTSPADELYTPDNLNYLTVAAGFNDITINGSDPSGGYNATNFYWTCGVSALYNFRLKGFIHVYMGGTSAPYDIGFKLVHWDSAGVVKSVKTINPSSFYFNPFSQYYFSFEKNFTTLNMVSGDVVQLVFFILNRTALFQNRNMKVYFSEDTFWEISGNSLEGEGGTILTAEKGTNFMLKNELKANIPANLWKTIKSNPYKLLSYQVTDDGEARSMNLYDFTRNIISGVTDGETRGRLLTPLTPDIDPSTPVEPTPEEGDGG